MTKSEIIKEVKKIFLEKIKKNQYYTHDDIMHACSEVLQKMYLENDFKKLSLSMKNGNLKLEKNIKIFNMPSIATCKHACDKCYTLKAERMRDKVRKHRARNFLIILLCLYDNDFKKIVQSFFVNEILQHGMLYNMPIVRIHESGDFFHNDYIIFWQEIMQQCKKQNKKILFYTYTKYKNVIFSKNLCNIIDSIFEVDNKKYINYGKIEYIKEVALKLKNNNINFSICSYKMTEKDVEILKNAGLYDHIEFKKCGTCTACMFKKIVLFKIH